ncbi:MAG: glycosyltransferase, partial [Vicinamibacterales bacterium]
YETGGEEEVSPRFFEGIAAGAVVLGAPPRCAAYDRCFDWPDAVIPTAAHGGQIAALMAELEANPRRIAQMRRDNVVNALQRHDWAYRWRWILDSVGLAPSRKMVEREERLESMARAVGAGLPDR